MVPRPLDAVHLHVGLRAGAGYPLARAAVHPGLLAVDEGDGRGRVKIRDDARQHGSDGPAVLELHAEECILATAGNKMVLW